MEPTGGRRATDNISADIALAIEEAAAETRHTLRAEITVVAAHLEAMRLQNATEHTEVKGHVMELIEDMAEIKQVVPTIAEIKQRVSTEAAVAAALEKQQATMERNRTAIRNYALGLAGLLLTAALGIIGLILTAPH